MNIPEADWQTFKALREKALGRLCDRILEDIRDASAKDDISSHEKYLEVYSLVQQRDKELGYIFDGLSRSKALVQLSLIQAKDLATPEELSNFSDATRDYLEHFRQ